MGTVWLAEHVMLGRQVAIKVLHREASARPELVERFFNEAKAATAISDPGIVQIFDFGLNTDGHAYIVMELLEGEPLDQRLRRMTRLPLASSLRILRQVASSLGAAHRRGIVHRDMKPDNIFLVRDPEVAGGERTKILDFGIAKLSSDHQRVKTQTSAVMGTPVFMSPEQCRGAGQVDRRSDVYSLGCVLYTLLTGHPPFDGEGPGDIIAMHLREPAPAPSLEVPGLPPEIDELVLRCLSKDRDKRYDSGTELAVAIEGLIERLAPLFASTGAPAAARTVASGELGRGSSRPGTGQPPPAMSPPRMETGPAAPTLTPVPPPGAPQPWGQPSSSGSNAMPRQVARAASEESTAAFPKISPPSPMPPAPPAAPMPSAPPPVQSSPQPQFPSPMPSSMGPAALSTPPVTLETFAASGERPAISNSSTTLSAYAGSRGPSKRPPRRLWMMGGVAAVGAVLGIALVTQLAGGDEPSTAGNDAALAMGTDLADSGAAPTDLAPTPTPVPGQGPGDAPNAGSAGAPDPSPSPSTGDGAAAGSAAPAPTEDPAIARAAEARARTEDNLRAVVAAFAGWAPENGDKPCPSLSTLALPGSEGKDGWGNDLRITCKEQPEALQMGVVSAGADGRFATDDDVFSWKISGASDQVRGARWVAKAPEKVPEKPTERPGDKPLGKTERPTPVIGSQTPRPVVPDKRPTRQPKPSAVKKPAIDPVTGLPLTRNPIQKPK